MKEDCLGFENVDMLCVPGGALDKLELQRDLVFPGLRK